MTNNLVKSEIRMYKLRRLAFAKSYAVQLKCNLIPTRRLPSVKHE